MARNQITDIYEVMFVEIEIHQKKPVYSYQGDLYLLAEHDLVSGEIYLQSLSHGCGLSIHGKLGELGLPGKKIGFLKAIVVDDRDLSIPFNSNSKQGDS